jgi:LPXTG-motif cell wall-anchored protein
MKVKEAFMLRRTLVLAGALLLAFAPGVASAQTYGGGTVAVSDGTVVAGQTITATAGCFTGNVIFTLGDTAVGNGIADLDGNVSVQITIPADLAPGTYTLTATGEACDGSGQRTVTTEITVVAGTGVGDPGTGAPGTGVGTPGAVRVGVGTGTLPRTGAESTFPLLQAGTVLVLVGAGVLFSIRNRRRDVTVTDAS